MDPMLVLERKQERQARSRQGRQARAKASLEELFEGEAMDQDQSAQVEDLLLTWYEYEASYSPPLGAPSASASCREYRTADFHDTVGDDRDAMITKITAELVGKFIDELPVLQRAAIQVHFRNKTARASVHRNPRIEDQHRTYLEAKEALFPKLKREGLIR